PGRVGRCQAKEERALPLIGGALFVLALCLLVVENCKSTVIFGKITKFPAKACKSAVIFRNNGANRAFQRKKTALLQLFYPKQRFQLKITVFLQESCA
ncbi:hypothetical protein, partial [Paenibacillus barengoltzii]|uniref:hypothetical protein n=1 Tax=Paenibacillus barengoltzii TaxID=343517 RepID=UPI002FDAF802